MVFDCLSHITDQHDTWYTLLCMGMTILTDNDFISILLLISFNNYQVVLHKAVAEVSKQET